MSVVEVFPFVPVTPTVVSNDAQSGAAGGGRMHQVYARTIVSRAPFILRPTTSAPPLTSARSMSSMRHGNLNDFDRGRAA
jgi:hypothetical protein